MKKRLIAAACVLFWLAVWQVGAMLLGQELLLVSPVRAAGRLLELIPTEASCGAWLFPPDGYSAASGWG